MKTLSILLLLSGLLGLAAAEEYPLWPHPQEIRFAGGAATYVPPDPTAAEAAVFSSEFPDGTSWSLGEISEAPVSPLPPEGYRLRVTPDGIAVTGADRAGLRHGIRTLRQLARRQPDGSLFWPCVEITDAPVIRSRGAHFMLNQYPWSEAGAASAYRFIDTLAALKYNLLVIQLDALPDYRSYPLSGEGHWSFEQLAQLCRYAENQGFEVIPALQLGGHSVWLTAQPGLEIYREKAPDRRTDPPSWDDTLCPGQPEADRLICSFIDEIVDAFQPRRFMLGYDEMLVGEKLCPHCRQLEAPMAELYARQVNTFAGHLRERDVEAIIWADQLLDFELRHALYGNRLEVDGPAFAAALNRDLTLAPWYYGSDPAAFAVSDSYMRERGFEKFLGTCMCFTDNVRALAEAVRKHGWEGGIHTFWYHVKGPALQSVSTYVWNNLPVFADAMWNSGRAGNADRTNRLNCIRTVWGETGPALPVAPERQFPLSGETANSGAVTTADGVEVRLGAARSFTELPFDADGREWERIYLALHCDAPENADKLQSPTDYDGSTTFPEIGSVEFEYTDGSRAAVPLQYKWNIVEANPEREIFGAESIFSADGRREIAAVANPHPEQPLRRVTLRAATPTILYYSGATAVAAAISSNPKQEAR